MGEWVLNMVLCVNNLSSFLEPMCCVCSLTSRSHHGERPQEHRRFSEPSPQERWLLCPEVKSSSLISSCSTNFTGFISRTCMLDVSSLALNMQWRRSFEDKTHQVLTCVFFSEVANPLFFLVGTPFIPGLENENDAW